MTGSLPALLCTSYQPEATSAKPLEAPQAPCDPRKHAQLFIAARPPPSAVAWAGAGPLRKHGIAPIATTSTWYPFAKLLKPAARVPPI